MSDPDNSVPNLLPLLQRHASSIRMALDKGLGAKDDYPEKVALALFDVWWEDLKNNKLEVQDLQNNELEIVKRIYTSSTTLTPKKLGEKVFNANVNPYVSRARDRLERLQIPLEGCLLFFDIKDRKYAFSVSLEKDPLAARRLIWPPYIEDRVRPFVVACVKRLFFKINQDVYVRNTTVNEESEWSGCPVLNEVVGKGHPHTVRLYVPSGEASSTFALLDLFNNELRLEPGVVGDVIEPHYKDQGKNLIVLGSGIEDPRYTPPANLGLFYKKRHNGVINSDSKHDYSDEATPTNLMVHVILQRWQRSDKTIITVIYGSHAAAIEEVVRHLVVEELALDLIKKHPRISSYLRKRAKLECLFAVNLQREGDGFRRHDISVIIPDTNRDKFTTKARRARRSLKRTA